MLRNVDRRERVAEELCHVSSRIIMYGFCEKRKLMIWEVFCLLSEVVRLLTFHKRILTINVWVRGGWEERRVEDDRVKEGEGEDM